MNVLKTILGFSAVALLTLNLPTATLLNAQESTPAAHEAAPLAQNLIGTWVLAGTPDKIEEAPAKGGRFLFLTGKHWCITQADPETGVTVFHHGGTYTLNGNQYAETVEYANDNTKDLLKQTNKFTLKLDGDTLTKTGIGNPWNEVWKRLK
jgi:hypothetical protein